MIIKFNGWILIKLTDINIEDQNIEERSQTFYMTLDQQKDFFLKNIEPNLTAIYTNIHREIRLVKWFVNNIKTFQEVLEKNNLSANLNIEILSIDQRNLSVEKKESSKINLNKLKLTQFKEFLELKFDLIKYNFELPDIRDYIALLSKIENDLSYQTALGTLLALYTLKSENANEIFQFFLSTLEYNLNNSSVWIKVFTNSDVTKKLGISYSHIQNERINELIRNYLVNSLPNIQKLFKHIDKYESAINSLKIIIIFKKDNTTTFINNIYFDVSYNKQLSNIQINIEIEYASTLNDEFKINYIIIPKSKLIETLMDIFIFGKWPKNIIGGKFNPLLITQTNLLDSSETGQREFNGRINPNDLPKQNFYIQDKYFYLKESPKEILKFVGLISREFPTYNKEYFFILFVAPDMVHTEDVFWVGDYLSGNLIVPEHFQLENRPKLENCLLTINILTETGKLLANYTIDEFNLNHFNSVEFYHKFPLLIPASAKIFIAFWENTNLIIEQTFTQQQQVISKNLEEIFLYINDYASGMNNGIKITTKEKIVNGVKWISNYGIEAAVVDSLDQFLEKFDPMAIDRRRSNLIGLATSLEPFLQKILAKKGQLKHISKEFLKQINNPMAIEDWNVCTDQLGQDSLTHDFNFEIKRECLTKNEIKSSQIVIKNLKNRQLTSNNLRVCNLIQTLLLSNLMRNFVIHSVEYSMAFIFYEEYVITFRMILTTFLYIFNYLDEKGGIIKITP